MKKSINQRTLEKNPDLTGIVGYPSLEMRWFGKKTRPDWLERIFKGRHCECRSDYYWKIPLPDHNPDGIKWREGRLEVKQKAGELTVSDLPERAEKWVKYALGSMELPADDPQWIKVDKERQLVKYKLTASGLQEVTEGHIQGSGCLIELTTLEINGAQYWTLGLEAFGDERAKVLRQTYLRFAKDVGPGLTPELSKLEYMSYPAFLNWGSF